MEAHTRRTLVTAVAALLAGTLGAAAQPDSTRPSFEVASVKDFEGPKTGPRDFLASYGPRGIHFKQSLIGVISEAYRVMGGRIVWPRTLANDILYGMYRDGYEIVANTDHPVDREQLRLMTQSLLADRFKLTVHRETRTAPVYRLVVAKDGPKLEESTDGGDVAFSRTPEGMVFRNAEVTRLVGALSSYLDRAVVDETGLTGAYNFTLRIPEDVRVNPPVKSEGISPDSLPSNRFAESLKRLGLQLVAGNASLEYLVVDHAERPTAN